MTFGVPIQGLPITSDGEMKTASHLKWYQRRTAKEAFLLKHYQQINNNNNNNNTYSTSTTTTTTVEFPGIDIPARMDVLLGRGKPFQEYPGNRRLLEVVEAYSQEYATAVTGEKSRVADWIVTVIQSGASTLPGSGALLPASGVTVPVRFLKRDADSGWWVPVENDIAREKVCSALRKTKNHATQRLSTSNTGASASNGGTSAATRMATTGVVTTTGIASASTTKLSTAGGGFVMQQQGVKRVKF
jgi:hypothetical protein